MASKTEEPPQRISYQQSLENDYDNITMFSRTEIEIIYQCEDENLKNALILNRKKKYTLLKILNRLKNHKQHLLNQKTECRHFLVTDIYDVKRTSTFRLGMPYFKDQDMYSAPYNSDYHKIKDSNELVQQSYCSPRPWSIADKTKLALSVYKNICKEKTEDLKNQIAILEKKDKESSLLEKLYIEMNFIKNKDLIYKIATKWSIAKIMTEDEMNEHKEELNKKISYLQSEVIQTNYKLELSQKLESMKKELEEIEPRNYITSVVATWTKNIDWLYISCKDVSRHNDQECEFMWNAYINPKVNKKPWTENENTKLVDIAYKHKMQNWESISKELDLNKSSYQCCIHFFSKLWDNYRRTKWSIDEEVYLKTLINMLKIGSFIPWGKVSKYFSERSKAQIYKHYINCLQFENIKKGVFSLCEDILLCALLKHYNNLQKATYFFPNRSLNQLRDRLKTMGFNYRDWTFDDDIKILQHVETYGESNWKSVGIDRCPTIIRHRYNVLKKWIIDHPGENIAHVMRRKKGATTRNKYLENKFLLEKIVAHLLEEIHEGESPEIVLNLNHIEKILTNFGVKEKRFSKVKKKTPDITLTSVINNFFKYYHNFKGRQRNLSELDHTAGAEQIKTILSLLGAKLNIPDANELKNNPILDEFDLRILGELSETNIDTDPQPGPSNQTQNLTIIVPEQNTVMNVTNTNKDITDNQISTPNQITTYIPPEPTTLIGFRGLMLFAPELKNFAANRYLEINRFLPSDCRLVTKFTSIKQTMKFYNEQINSLDTNKRKIVLNERNMFRNRFRSLFKWPALMSLPENKPPENVFVNKIVVNKTSATKKVGRPAKISEKVIRMIEGKKRKKIVPEGEMSSNEKKPKTEN